MVLPSMSSRGTSFTRPVPAAPKHPFLGHVPDLSKRFANKQLPELSWIEWTKLTNSKIVEMNIPFSRPMVIVADPDAAKSVIMDKNLPKSAALYAEFEPLVGKNSLTTAHGPIWEAARSAFNPGFSASVLRDAVPKFAFLTQRMAANLGEAAKNQEAISVFKLSTLLTMDAIVAVLLGCDLNFQDQAKPPSMYGPFLAILDRVAADQRNPLGRRLNQINPIEIARTRAVQQTYDQEILSLVETYLADIAKVLGVEPAASNPALPLERRLQLLQEWYLLRQRTDKAQLVAALAKRDDMLSIAFRTSLATAQPLTVEDMMSQVKVLFTGGHDTTASTISWALHLLAIHPEAQKRAQHEVDDALGGRADGSIDTDTLSKMPFINDVLKEVLRLYPVAGTVRYAPPGEVLQGLDVGDKNITINQYMLHRDPDMWGPDADEFKPERWADKAYIDKIHPYSYIPFMKGPRDCIGKNMALLEARTVLAVLLRRFTFSFREAEPEYLHVYFTYKPANGVMLHVEERAATH